MIRKILFLINVLIIGSFGVSFAQFYNGHQMDFGKKRVQYNDFFWSYIKGDKYDVYFNQEGEAIARFTDQFVYNEIVRIEKMLNYELKDKLILVVFNKYSDFKQSNIGLITGKTEYNTGGVTKINRNKISLFFQGNHLEYEQQIKETIAEAIITEMLLGSSLSENISSSALLNLPDWFVKGLGSYLAEEWSMDIENRVKDGILSGSYLKLNHLTQDDAKIAGHSFWRYLNDYYGSTIIPDLLFITRINKGINHSLSSVLGVTTKELTNQWIAYYEDYFTKEKTTLTDTLSDQKNIIRKSKPEKHYYQFKISPAGNYIAYVSNESGLYKIWIYNTQTGKSKKVYKNGYKLKQINDYTYPVISWHPSGKYLTIITESENKLQIIQYSLDNNSLSTRNLFTFDKILDFSYSADGSKMIFSAVRNGLTDLFIYDVASSTSTQLTNDLADEFHPSFIKNDSEILFSSNSITEDSETKKTKSGYINHSDLFVYKLNQPDKNIVNLSNTNNIDELQAFEQNNNYIYLNNKNGIQNLYIAYYDSTISFIDTAIHYRYYLNEKALSNYSRNVIEHSISKSNDQYVKLFFQNNKHVALYDNNIHFDKLPELKPSLTQYRKKTDAEITENIESDKLQPDSIIIFSAEDNYVDINHYTFEFEKPYFTYKYNNEPIDTAIFEKSNPKIQIYQRTFFTDELVSQVDFSFLSSSYQTFTGGAVYFNPGLNGLIKIGATDLLEDYKIIAGVRLSLDFKSNEYLISFENLKKKIDEQYIFHRQSFENTTPYFTSKTLSHKLMYIRTLPFSQVSGLTGSLTGRYDKLTYLATDRNTLQKPDNQKLWGGLKLEYIFDNTLSNGVNLYSGTRYKIVGEYYRQINDTESDLFVLGTDFRHYIEIHRGLTFASRLAASTSFGKNKLIYYLGGVDNWTNFSGKTPTFVPLNEIPINTNEKYAFQASATNMRGFPQNIRNGNSFALINTELRWPFVKYFSNTPLSSTFLTNLQLVGFFDIGTAWSGSSPWSEENAYNIQEIYYKPITIKIDTGRDPIVAGYGVGLRVMLLGYFIRLDYAWGIENQEVMPRVFYFSLSLDF
ncbi:MAG: hypothetical protein AB7S50_06910 [Bacteroidales bacterium]